MRSPRSPRPWPLRSLVSFLALAVISAILAVTPGCTCNKKPSGKTQVAVTIFPIYDLVRRVAGPDADVQLLLPPGKSEHAFDPKMNEIEKAAASKLGVMIGLGLDMQMEKLMKEAAPTARLLKLGEKIPTMTISADPIGDEAAHKGQAKDEDDHDDKGAVDPHVWLDPKNAMVWAKLLGDELAAIDPPHAAGYKERAAKLVESLGALDSETEARTKAWKNKGFVTFHGSFSYFAKRYGLKIIAVIEPYPGSNPSLDYVQAVLQEVQKQHVPGLFSEPQLDPKPAQTIAEQAKIPLGVLDPVGGVPESDSYEKLIRFNVDALEKILK